MIQCKMIRNLSAIAGLLLVANSAILHAQEIRTSLCFEDLVQRNWCELEQIYRQAKPGNIPVGFLRGQIIYCSSQPLAHCKQRLSGLIWHGKHFCTDGTLVNQWTGMRAIRARVDYGPSLLDGQPAIILDYHGMSRVWDDVRDEMREVAPGLYVGAMYRNACTCPKLEVFFVLQASCGCGQ